MVEDAGGYALLLSSSRLAQSVFICDEIFTPEDDGFHLAPGETRRVRLFGPAGAKPCGEVRALNGLSPVSYAA